MRELGDSLGLSYIGGMMLRLSPSETEDVRRMLYDQQDSNDYIEDYEVRKFIEDLTWTLGRRWRKEIQA